MDHSCRRCGLEATKRCSGCQKEWYCSEDCQQKQWALHIFDCNVPQPPNTAYRLARACYEDLIPDDPETRIDYGFTNCRSDDDEGRLISLYVGLIRILGVKPSVLHRARVKRRLIDEICKHYETRPSGHRGLYYPWFLDNLYILNGPSTANNFPEPPKGWSVGDLILFLQDKSMKFVPTIGADFGFFNCKGKEEIAYLKDVYIRYFQAEEADPMALQVAAIEGKLYHHVSQHITVPAEEASKLERLMENPYPLSEED